ncbi:hypothetical protein LCGC14_2903030, partial [marine sediment metagenome]
MTLTQAFANTKVTVDKSLQQIEGLMEVHGIREQRYTHLRPEDPAAAEGEVAQGTIAYEFVRHGKEDNERRGVRIVVRYQPTMIRVDRRTMVKRKVKGTTAQMAGRALFWFLKAKFDSIDYGIEEFDVAFMPHLITQLGPTFAERPD